MRLPQWLSMERGALIALVLLGLFKGLFWATLLPPWKIADEPAHFDNVQYRAEHFEAPTLKREGLQPVMNPGASLELRRSWEYTQRLFRGAYYLGTGTAREERELRELGREVTNRIGDGQMTAVHYPGAYYNSAVPAYLLFKNQSILVRLYAVRCVSLLYGLMAIVATFLAARLAFSSLPLAFAAGSLVALQPMESQMTIACNNDAGLIGWSALGFYFLVRILKKLPSLPRPWEVVAAGVACGLAVMTKNQAVALLPIFGVIGLLLVGRNLLQWRAWALGVLAVVALVGSSYPQLEDNFAKYMPGWSVLFKPDPAAPPATMPSHAPGHAQRPSPPPAAATAAPVYPPFSDWFDHYHDNWKEFLFKSVWGNFGWLDYALPTVWITRLHKVAYFFWAGLLSLAVLTCVLLPSQRRWFDPRILAAALALVVLSVGVVLYAEYYVQTRLNVTGMIQGRNFLFGLPGLAILMAGAVGALLPRRLRPLGAAMLMLGMLILNLSSIATILRHNCVS